MMLYKDMKVIVRSSDDGTNLVDIVVEDLQRNTIVFLFIICPNYVRQNSIDIIK